MDGVELTSQNLDFRNLLEITAKMYTTFWNPPTPSRPTHGHIKAIITERRLKPDITSFLKTFSALYGLTSKEAADACREDVAKLVDKLWEMSMPTTADSHLPTDEGTFQLVHLSMESGGQFPFLALYSSASKESFNHEAGYWKSPVNVGSVQCAEFMYVFINLKTDHTSDLDNLLSIANSIINLFWPSDPSYPRPAGQHLQGLVEKHGIEEDFGALCYTFSILLKIASEEAIRERKEEVRGVTSSVMRILEEDKGLVVSAIKTTHQQLYCARAVLCFIKYHKWIDAVAEGLVLKLWKLSSITGCIVQMTEVCVS